MFLRKLIQLGMLSLAIALKISGFGSCWSCSLHVRVALDGGSMIPHIEGQGLGFLNFLLLIG